MKALLATLIAALTLVVIPATASAAATTPAYSSCNNLKWLSVTSSLANKRIGQSINMFEVNHYRATSLALEAARILKTGSWPCHRWLIKARSALWLQAQYLAEAGKVWYDDRSANYWLQNAVNAGEDFGDYLERYRDTL